MNKNIAALVLAGALLAPAAALAGGQEVVEEIVALVNDDIITLSDYRTQFEMTLAQLRAAGLPPEEYDKQYARVKQELLESMITEMLLLQKAKELGLNVQEQIKGMIQKIMEDNSLATEADLRRAVEQQGMPYEVWLKQYEEGMMRQAVLYSEIERSIVLDDAEVVQYYRKNPAEFTTPTEYKLNAIYLATEGRPAEECERLKAEVDAKLQGGASFADAAGELSDPPLKEAKGELGTFKEGELEETLEKAVAGLKDGERSAWANTKNGWYLLQLAEKKPSALRPFEDARREVEDKLFNEKRAVKAEAYLKQLRDRSYVKVLKADPLGK
jgi:peptidyl-prolyl cis-trans isomerase SurA